MRPDERIAAPRRRRWRSKCARYATANTATSTPAAAIPPSAAATTGDAGLAEALALFVCVGLPGRAVGSGAVGVVVVAGIVGVEVLLGMGHVVSLPLHALASGEMKP